MPKFDRDGYILLVPERGQSSFGSSGSSSEVGSINNILFISVFMGNSRIGAHLIASNRGYVTTA